MSKPKPKRAEPTFVAPSHSLSDTAKQKLSEILGSDNQKAIVQIETALGLGIHGATHLDERPRPADYVAAFKPLEQRAAELLNMLHGLGGYFSGQFIVQEADKNAIEAALLDLGKVAGNVVKEFKQLPSKGARKNSALAEVTRRLRRTFDNYYAGPVEPRRKSGAFEYRSESEKRELEFVEVALRDARLIRANYTGLEALLRDPRCALSNERPQIIERIARRIERQRARPGEKKR